MEIGIIVGVVLGVVGFALGRALGKSAGVDQGRREGRDEGVLAGRDEAGADVEHQVRSLVDAVSRGRRPEVKPSSPAVAALLEALEAGWTPRDAERQRALREAIGRVSAYLDKSVRAPLAEATAEAGAAELYERVQRALGSLEDLDFFVKEPALQTEGRDLPPLVQQVTREFAQDQSVGIRMALDGRPVRAKVNPAALMDALYLVLHNAARFGGGATIDVTVVTEGGAARIKVRDRGKGFSEEAFRRAFDPFYSTTDDGLGLGLPHARRAIEGMGGRIELRNVPDGGGEVEISFPV
ncbi:MAG: hypothetical protein AMXMBFR53_12420 [Gemmatimonadota bacterium]